MKAAKIKAQQGDVLLRKIKSLPNNVEVRSRGRCVLAEGEVTGHAHVVEDDEAELLQAGERLLLVLKKQATVTHQEHGHIKLEPGIWEIGRVQEYDYLSHMAHDVLD